MGLHPSVENQPAIGEFGGTAFVRAVAECGAEAPTCARVVADDGVRVVGAIGPRVIRRDDESPCVRAVRELDAASGAGRVPAPFGAVGLCRDVGGFCPSEPVVCGDGVVGAAAQRGFARADVAFVLRAGVPSKEKMDRAGFGVHDGAGIAAGVGVVVPDGLLRAPCFAGIGGTTEDEVYIPCVASAALTRFGESEDVAVRCRDEGRDAVGVVAVGAVREDGQFFRTCGRCEEQRGYESGSEFVHVGDTKKAGQSCPAFW